MTANVVLDSPTGISVFPSLVGVAENSAGLATLPTQTGQSSLLELRTGADTAIWPSVGPQLVEYLPVRELLLATTGYGRLNSLVLCAFLSSDNLEEESLTTWRTRIHCRRSLWVGPLKSSGRAALVMDPRSAPTRAVASADLGFTPAERLREAAGLDAGRLAAIFGVSRVTYQNWIAGATPQDLRREHLLGTLTLVEEARQRLGDPHATADWLLTPVSATGLKPIDLLAAREYEAFRGFLLRVPTRQRRVRPLASPNRVHRRLSPDEVDDALARLRPRAWSADMELEEAQDFGSPDGDRE